jgi:chromosome segregation ATPase
VKANRFLEQQVRELTLTAKQAIEAQQKAEQARKTAADQLYTLRQEAEIQREDLRSAEAGTKKAWKIVADASAKASAQAKDLKEAKEASLQMVTKVENLQRTINEITSSAKLGNVEKSRLEAEISTLQRRVKMEQELTLRAEADLALKARELAEVKKNDSEVSKAKLDILNQQKEKLEAALRDWQTKHAEIASRLDASETHKSRIALEIEDLVNPHKLGIDYRIMN